MRDIMSPLDGITSPLRRRSGGSFTPSALFSSGEQGAWYDPSDLSTMFQDAAGTTPVTAVEQPVGLLLDKSKGGRQSLAVTGWAAEGSGDGTVTVVGNTITITGATTTTRVDLASPGWAIGNYADITVTGSVAGATGQTLFLGGAAPYSTLSGTNTFRNVIVSSTLLRLQISTGSATFVVTSRGYVPGNHASQSTSASRPVLSARVNQLLATATLSTQNVTTLAATYTLAFSGAGTVTATGTNIGVYSAGSNSLVCTAGTLTLTVVGSVTLADLRVTNDGVGLPAYQAVVTSTNYDTSGFPLYLKFDGTDDSLATVSITPGADKAQVFAGIRKTSDSALAIVAELSATIASNAGAFAITAPNSAAANYNFSSKGTTQTDNTVTTYTSPLTSVLSGIADIAGASNVLRANNAQVGSVLTTQGTGNYLAYPVYIGRRGGTTNPFNGRIYSMILRFGANLSDAQIASTETWVNGKTGAY